jgi:general nucleoside transport system permease protein
MNTLAAPALNAAPPIGERLAALFDSLLPALAASALTVLLFSAAVALAGFDALEVWGLILMGGFGDAFAWQNTLQRAAPLILTGLAVALPAQAGRVIIGAEGALVLGGLAAAAFGLLLSATAPPWVVWPLMALAGMLMGGLWIGIAGSR